MAEGAGARTGVGQLDLRGAVGDWWQVADGVAHRHSAQRRAHGLRHRRVLRARAPGASAGPPSGPPAGMGAAAARVVQARLHTGMLAACRCLPSAPRSPAPGASERQQERRGLSATSMQLGAGPSDSRRHPAGIGGRGRARARLDIARQADGELRRAEHVQRRGPGGQVVVRRHAPDERALARLADAKVARVEHAEAHLRGAGPQRRPATGVRSMHMDMAPGRRQSL